MSNLSFLGAVQIAFVILKLCKVINWAWFFVMIPAIIWLILVIIKVIIETKYGE